MAHEKLDQEEAMLKGAPPSVSALDMVAEQKPITSQALAKMPDTEKISKLLSEAKLTCQLLAPGPDVLSLLQDYESLEENAQEFRVDSDDDYKVANETWVSLKGEAELIEAARKEGTRGLLDLKGAWDMLFNPARDARLKAVYHYQASMKAYERLREQKAKDAQAEAERDLRRQKAETLEKAEALEKKAGTLKDGKRKAELLDAAQGLRTEAELQPETVALSSTAVPAMTDSAGRSKPWKGRLKNLEDWLRWCLDNHKTEWLAGVKVGQSTLDSLAKLVKDTQEIPGFEAYQDTTYRRTGK